jgi:hypothetical protein
VTDDARLRRLALNEAVAREVNDAVGEIAERWHHDDEPIEIICECSRESCSERIHVAIRDYAKVRAHDTRFLVRDDHVVEEIERRVGTAGDGTVVEKIGPGRQVAEATA